MEIMCPSCGVGLEIPTGIDEGRRFLCTCYSRHFIIRDGVAVAIVEQETHKAVLVDQGFNSSQKIPKLTLAGIVILYVFEGLSLLGNLESLLKTPSSTVGAIGWVVLMLAFTIVAHKRKNWGRVALTSLLGVLVLTCGLFSAGFAIVVAVCIATPVTFIWLPASNRWYADRR